MYNIYVCAGQKVGGARAPSAPLVPTPMNSGMPYFILNLAYAYPEAAQAVSFISESHERGMKAIQSVGPSE